MHYEPALSAEPGLRIRVAYFVLCHLFQWLRRWKYRIHTVTLWMDKPMTWVHRPILVWSARYTDALVNGKRWRSFGG